MFMLGVFSILKEGQGKVRFVIGRELIGCMADVKK